ncbi:MAG: IS1380 family transposase [Actinobacteria bacterium]|nr:IS1380 family transposase [Acidobacteriota bacterium]MCA1707197.1 IS1380 family transposase [Actinomycetota bacterium]
MITNRSRARERRIESRLDRAAFPDDLSQPMLRGKNLHFDLAGRAVGTSYGGIGLIHQLVNDIELAREIDERVHVFKIHLPYHESDHVLNLAYNALCDGTCLQDLELRRQDEAYLNALGALRIPDPTTAGDFCRRFKPHHLEALHQAIDAARLKVWKRQPVEFFAEAKIDVDGTLVATDGECKEGMDIAYDGTWGYHALIVSLANTGEVLRVLNRPGNRPSHEGGFVELDHAMDLCRNAGFRHVRLRGDTDFTQTQHLDRWHETGCISFVFGMDVTAGRHIDGDQLPETAWKRLSRPPRYKVRTKRRAKRDRVKQRRVEERGFKDIQLLSEDVAEMPYRPGACKHTYRLIVLRKNQQVNEPRQQRFFKDYKYFLYLTNDWKTSVEEVVFEANDRCNQENLLAQLKGGVRALRAPVDNLYSNGAYMIATCVAWNLKAWLALSVPPPGVSRERHAEERERLLRCEFRTFVNAIIRIPCQVVRTGRRIVHRLLAWNPWQGIFFRLTRAFRYPRRC